MSVLPVLIKVADTEDIFVLFHHAQAVLVFISTWWLGTISFYMVVGEY